MSLPLSVVHFIPGLHYRDGGPSRSVVRLTDSLAADNDIEITLTSHAVKGLQSIPSNNRQVCRRTFLTSNSLRLKWGLVDRQLVCEAVENVRVDLLHTHCLWHPANHWAMRLATKFDIPLVCQPRGMLEPWALNYKVWKKRLALLLFQRKDLERTRAFIATSAMEAESIRRIGLKQPIAIIPNGVDFPLNQQTSTTEAGLAERNKVVLFLSRMHPGKGALHLLEAWAKCVLPGWRVVLAGPDADGHLREVIRQIGQLGLSGSVTYVGEADANAKAALFSNADLLVLPSLGENFGMVVAEALSFGVPVITTKCTPWQGLEKHECGWWIDIGVEPLVKALRSAMSLSDQDRSEMGQRGKLLVASYQWSTAASQTAEVYRWLLGRGDRPDCVMGD